MMNVSVKKYIKESRWNEENLDFLGFDVNTPNYKMIDLGRYYTRQDINQISDIMGYSVWERKGGWYTKPGTNQHYPTCRHTWMQTGKL